MSPWVIWVPGILAVAVACLFWVIDQFAVLLGTFDTAQPGLQWLNTGANGQFALGLAGVVVLIAGATHPLLRHGAALTAWGIIALEICWFLLTAWLSN